MRGPIAGSVNTKNSKRARRRQSKHLSYTEGGAVYCTLPAQACGRGSNGWLVLRSQCPWHRIPMCCMQLRSPSLRQRQPVQCTIAAAALHAQAYGSCRGRGVHCQSTRTTTATKQGPSQEPVGVHAWFDGAMPEPGVVLRPRCPNTRCRSKQKGGNVHDARCCTGAR
jgi:hypothetical protein